MTDFKIIFTFLVFFSIDTGQTSQLSVCAQNCSATLIRNALVQAKDGDEILVKKGLYLESKLIVSKKLKIKAESNVIVDGSGEGDIFIVLAHDVEISGFDIRNTGFSYIEERAGIHASKSDGCEFYRNRFDQTAYGIYVAEVTGCKIEKNEFTGLKKSESQSGDAIHLWNSKNFEIVGNNIEGHRDGIYLEFAKEGRIENNLSKDNSRYGLHFMFSDGNQFRKNRFSNNGAGVAVMYSKRIGMYENYFDHSQGSAAYGLLLKDIMDSQVVSNQFESNTVAVYMDGSNRLNFTANLFKNNGWGLRILADCDANVFKDNSFIMNTYDVTTNSFQSPNQFDANFWDVYEGIDFNIDGFGDLPFRPVRLSGVMVEQYGLATLLGRSLFFELIDHVEQMMPVITPPSLKDDHPRIKSLIDFNYSERKT